MATVEEIRAEEVRLHQERAARQLQCPVTWDGEKWGRHHEFGKPWHTHLGHKTLGGHMEHRECAKCRAVLNYSFGRGKTFMYYGIGSYLYSWERAPGSLPHRCSAGWQGFVDFDGEFTGESLMPKDVSIVEPEKAQDG